MMHLKFRPIDQWPGERRRSHKRSVFRASYSNTLRLLDDELRRVGARSVVLQVALTEDKIRLDGMPYCNSRPTHPGVILSVESKHGSLSFPCDTYDSWEDNLRAIALAMQALRAVDRYGVTKRGEQYKGWAKLPSPEDARREAIIAVADVLRASPDFVRERTSEAIAAAVKRAHPDHGGNVELLQRVLNARAVLNGKQD